MVAVPNQAARVNLVLISDYFTSTIVKRISFIAGLADALRLIELTTLRFNFAADTFEIEEISFGALQTNLVIPLAAAVVVAECY